MSKLLSVAIAAVFAAASASALAQSKDVTTKGDAATVKSKDGKAVTTKDVKEAPKPKAAAPAPAKEPKAKPATTEVKTKSGGAVTSKDGKDVKSTK